MLNKKLMIMTIIMLIFLINIFRGVYADVNVKEEVLKAYILHSGLSKIFEDIDMDKLDEAYELVIKDFNGDGEEEKLLIPKRNFQVETNGWIYLDLALLSYRNELLDLYDIYTPESFTIDQYNNIHLILRDNNYDDPYKQKYIILRYQDNEPKEIWSREVGSYSTIGFRSKAEVRLDGLKSENLLYIVKQESFNQTNNDTNDTYTSTTTYTYDPIQFKFIETDFQESRVPLLLGTDRSETSLGGVQLGDGLARITDTLGAPHGKRVDLTFQELATQTLEYPGIIMGLEITGHPYIRYLIVSDEKYTTKRGIKIGDTLDKVKEKYGEPDIINSDWDSTYIQYKSALLKDELDLLYRYHLRFYFSKKDIVNKIEIFDYDYGF